MKTLSLTAIAIFSASAVFAQTKSNNVFQLSAQQLKHFADVQTLLSAPQNEIPVSTLSGKRQRLIAQVFEQDGVDSVVYKYSAGKGSQYNYNHILEPGYSTVLAPTLAPACANTYSQASTDVPADSFAAYYNSNCYYRSRGSYNTFTKLDSFYRFDVGTELENEEWGYISYNADGLVDTLINAVAGLDGGKAPVYLRAIKYNKARQVVDDKGYYNQDGAWMDMQQFRYRYNSTGHLDTLTSIGTDGYSEQSVISYDAAGRMTRLKLYALNESGAYEHYLTDTFGYTSGIAYITSFEELYFNEGLQEGGVRIIQHPGLNGKPDSIVSEVLIGEHWVTATQGKFAYNDYGNPSSITFTEVMSGATSSLRFHYETY